MALSGLFGSVYTHLLKKSRRQTFLKHIPWILGSEAVHGFSLAAYLSSRFLLGSRQRRRLLKAIQLNGRLRAVEGKQSRNCHTIFGTIWMPLHWEVQSVVRCILVTNQHGIQRISNEACNSWDHWSEQTIRWYQSLESLSLRYFQESLLKDKKHT